MRPFEYTTCRNITTYVVVLLYDVCMETKQLHIQIPIEMHKALRLLAVERDSTMSALVLEAIERALLEVRDE